MTASIDYLNKNYLTLEQLSKITNTSIDKINELIKTSCIPNYSHKLTQQTIVHSDIFGSTQVICLETIYFHPSVVNWIATSKDAEQVKNNFYIEFKNALNELTDAREIFPQCFDAKNQLIEDEAQQLFAQHWHYVLDGTYGVCLKEISAKNILIKSISVAQLKAYLAQDNNKLSIEQKNQFLSTLNNYDTVASEFGPHEFEKSTRKNVFKAAEEIYKNLR